MIARGDIIRRCRTICLTLETVADIVGNIDLDGLELDGLGELLTQLERAMIKLNVLVKKGEG